MPESVLFSETLEATRRIPHEHAGAASAIATEQGFAFELAYGTLVRGWALAQQDRLEEGIAGMRRAVTASEARDLNFFAMEIWRRRLIQNEGEVGPMQKLPQTLNTFADATILLTIIAFIALAAWLLAHSG
jgi:hypothetical protein